MKWTPGLWETCWRWWSARHKWRPHLGHRCSLSGCARNFGFSGHRAWPRAWTGTADELEYAAGILHLLRDVCRNVPSFGVGLFRRAWSRATEPGSWSRSCLRWSCKPSHRRLVSWQLLWKKTWVTLTMSPRVWENWVDPILSLKSWDSLSLLFSVLKRQRYANKRLRECHFHLQEWWKFQQDKGWLWLNWQSSFLRYQQKLCHC